MTLEKTVKRTGKPTPIEIGHIMPRNYLACINHGKTKYLLSIANSIMADIAVTPPNDLEEHVGRYIDYKKREFEKLDAGELPYDMQFQLKTRRGKNRRYETLSYSKKELSGIIREAIKKKEKSAKLWDRSGDQVIEDLRLRGFEAEAFVDSKGPRNRKVRKSDPDRPHKHYVTFKRMYLSDTGEMVELQPGCDCLEHRQYKQKGKSSAKNEMICRHLAILLNETHRELQGLTKRARRAKGVPGNAQFFPVNVIDDESLWNLKIDTLIDYYLMGNTYFTINKKHSQIRDIYTKFFTDRVAEGMVTFEIGKHRTSPKTDLQMEYERVLRRYTPLYNKIKRLRRRKKGPKPTKNALGKLDELRQEKNRLARMRRKEEKWLPYLRDDLQDCLEEGNYKRTGLFVEFRGTPYETPAFRFENENSIVGVVPMDGVYVATYRKKSEARGKREIGYINGSDTNPFARLNQTGRDYLPVMLDDCTKQMHPTAVFIPGKVKLSRFMKEQYGRFIQKYVPPGAYRQLLFNRMGIKPPMQAENNQMDIQFDTQKVYTFNPEDLK